MILSFEEYTTLGGTLLDEVEYSQIEPRTESLLEAYIREKIPCWKVQALEDYGMDLKKAILYQIDFIEAHGGMDCFVGSSDMNFTGATTSGFSYSVDNAKTIRFHDIPLSSLAVSELDYQLLKAGLACQAVW